MLKAASKWLEASGESIHYTCTQRLYEYEMISCSALTIIRFVQFFLNPHRFESAVCISLYLEADRLRGP